MIKIDGQRENYRPAGLRSAVLYFVLNDLVAIDPMYQPLHQHLIGGGEFWCLQYNLIRVSSSIQETHVARVVKMCFNLLTMY